MNVIKLVVAVSFVAVAVVATQVHWTGPVVQPRVLELTAAASAPPPVTQSDVAVVMASIHAPAPVAEEIAADLDTTGLLQPMDESLIDYASADLSADLLQGD